MRMYYEVNTDVGLNELFLVICILFLSRGCSLPIPHQGLLWWPECSRVTAGKKGQIGLQLTLLTLPSEGSHEAVRSRAEGLWTWPGFCPTASPRSQPLTISKHRSDHTDLSPWLLHGSYSDSMGQAVLDNLRPHCRFMRKGTFQLVFGGVRRGAYCKAIEYWNTTNSFEFLSMPFRLYLPPTSPTITYTYYS